MRFIAVILSVYIFYLISIPCADDLDGCVIQKSMETSHGHNPDNSGSTHECSPFCVCSCCHTNVTLSTISFVIEPVVVQFEEREFFCFSVDPEYYDAPWQPPRIG